MKILFIGAVEFSARALRELINIQIDIVGVCTLSSSPFNSDHEDLTPIASNAGIPVLSAPDLHCQTSLDWISKLKPDIIFCFGWSRLIKEPLLSLAPLGIIGFHPAALPANRGRHPLIWALVLGLTETASSFFFMDAGADSGDLISQVKIKIEPSDNASSLYKKVTDVAIEQINDFVPRLLNGTFERFPQNHSLANSWRKREAADGCIDWRMAADSIHNLVRGLSRPYIGAHFEFNGCIIKVWETAVEYNVSENLEPGKVLTAKGDAVLIKSGVAAIKLIDYAPKVLLTPGLYL